MLSQTESKSPCDSVPPSLMHMLCSSVQIGNITLPVSCEGVRGVQSALTIFCGGAAKTCHDDRVVELKEQLVVEEVDE